jgi:hypothetical protein
MAMDIFPMFLSSITDKNLTGRLWVTRRVFYKKQELLTLHEHLGSLPILISTSTRLLEIKHLFIKHLICAIYANKRKIERITHII